MKLAYIDDYAPTSTERKLAIAEMEAAIGKMDRKERKKVALVIGNRAFTPIEMLMELKQTNYQNLLIQIINKHRVLVEPIKNEEKK